MRVPVTPRTRAPNTTLGYASAPNAVSPLAAVGEGLTQLADIGTKFKEEEEKRRKAQEKFNISKRLIEEANFLDTDLTQRMEDADPGAPGFVERVNTDYDARHQGVLQEFRDSGMSEEGLQELELRHATLLSPFRQKALEFRNKSENIKARADSANLRDESSRYAYNNPMGVFSVIAEGEAAIRANPNISAEEKEEEIAALKKEVMNTAAVAYGRKNWRDVMRALAPEELSKVTTAPSQVDPTQPAGSFQDVAHKISAATGLPADQVAAVFSYETGGTFDPNIVGGKNNNHLGLIQFGREERKKYGIKEGSSPEEWATAISSYLADRGFKPGMSILDFYSTINAGRPGKYNASDGNGTVRTHVDKILKDHIGKAQQWLGSTPAQETVSGKTVVEEATPLDVNQDPILSALSGDQLNAALNTARSEKSRVEALANEQMRQASAAEKAAYDERFNNLLNGLMDGRLTQVDINNAYREGWLTDYDDRKKAQDIINAKQKKNDDLAMFQVMYRAGTKFNPYDDNAVKAAEAGFEQAMKDEKVVSGETTPLIVGMRLWERTGILVKPAAAMLRGGMISTDPNQVAASASVASNMLTRDPNAFAGVEGGEAIGQQAATYAHYVDDLGMSAEDAANKIALMNSPEAKVKQSEPERNKFIKDLGTVSIEKVVNDAVVGPKPWIPFTGPDRGSFVSQPQKAEATETYTELATAHYDQYHDAGAAKAYAQRQLGRFYGIEGGRLMKYPPSKAYPEINGSREYVFDQAAELVSQVAGFEIPKEDVFLQPTASGSSADAFRSGKPVPYEVHYITRDKGQPIYHVIPGKVFVADVGQAQRQAAAAARVVEQGIRAEDKVARETLYQRLEAR